MSRATSTPLMGDAPCFAHHDAESDGVSLMIPRLKGCSERKRIVYLVD